METFNRQPSTINAEPAGPARCPKCHEVHGPGWGARECRRHQRLFARLTERERRQCPPQTTDGAGRYLAMK